MTKQPGDGHFRMMDRGFIAFGGVFGCMAVGMAAVAAHGGLLGLDAATIEVVRSGVEMQGWHALALLFTGLWGTRGGWLARLAGVALVIGVLLFSGSLYGSAFLRTPVVLAPAGGMMLMAGWLLLGASALRARG